MLQTKTVVDATTGLAIKAIGREGADTSHYYFTAMTWLNDSRHLVLQTNIDRETLSGTTVLFDTETGITKVLEEESVWGSGIVSSDDWLYVIRGNELHALHPLSGARRTVCRLGADCTFHGPPSITNDGRTLGLYWARQTKKEAAEEGAAGGTEWIVGTVDAATGEVKEAIRPQFAEPYPVANHAMINPVDPEQIFFSHEGKTEHIPDRLWVADVGTQRMRNLFAQKRRGDGTHVEYVGHEMWAYDGSGLVFVKYPHSPDRPTGVWFVDRSGGASFVNGDYRYWHVGISPDGKHAAADTQEPGIAKIVLIDMATKRSRLLCELPCRGRHPAHPHPSFSPDSRKVTFSFTDERDDLWVGVMAVPN
ncbi:MAG: hypothetical protein J7639_12340 [Paenibacillaceae bacterium]|nr:hypothetical protein [Paenibacillaceae bacterium]